jgi:threonine/homoserine/homoserine lactone efflux protein
VIAYLIRGLVLGFPNAAVPGPFQAYLLSQTVRYGWKRALPAALAPLISDGPIIALVLFVLAQLTKQTLGLIQVAGGIFILYLALGAYRAIHAAEANRAAPSDSHAGLRGVLKGALMNALNPAPYVFWGTVGGPILLSGWRVSPQTGIAFLSGFYGTLIGAFAVFIYLFGALGGMHPKARKILSGISAAALCLFGLFQLVLGIMSAMGY